MKFFRFLILFLLIYVLLNRAGVPISAAEDTQTEGTETGPDLEFVAVPAGTFTMGSPEDAYPTFEIPETTVQISAFQISSREITNDRYLDFCEDADYPEPATPSWFDEKGDYFEEYADFPVVNVSWYDAVAFCEWFSESRQVTVRLPTEAEWERCARYSESESTPTYPWGDKYPDHHGEPNPDYADLIGSEDHFPYTAPVGFYPLGAALIGKAKVFDLVGNVSEWCRDRFSYNPFSGNSDGLRKDPQGPDRGFRRVVKGASFRDDLHFARPAFRRGYPPTSRVDTIGFRVVKESN